MIRDSKLAHNFNKNRTNILIRIVSILAVVIIIIFFIRLLFGNKNKQNNENTINNQTIYTPTETVISDTKVSEKDYENDESLVNSFIDNCKEGKTEDAYSYLSDECKDILYPTLEDFEEKYYNYIFNKQKTINIQSWITKSNFRTYKVRIIDDILSTGDYENSENYEDYITIDTKQNKLNINRYIGKQSVDKEKENDFIKIKIISKDLFLDYEIYNFEMQNKTNDAILLAPLDNDMKENIKLLNDNDINMSIYKESISINDIRIMAKSTKEVKLKFRKVYSSEYKDAKFEFNKIVKNYDKYTNDEEYDDYGSIMINL